MHASDSQKLVGEDGAFHVEDEAVRLHDTSVEGWAALALFWALGLTVFYQFLTRYALNDSAAWTEEIARYLLIVVTFVGSAMGVRRNTHIHVEFVYRWLPPGAARAMSTLVDVMRIAFFAYGSWLAFQLVPRMHNLKMTIVDFPMSYVYGIVAAGFVIATWRAVQVALRHWAQGWSVLERPGEHETGA